MNFKFLFTYQLKTRIEGRRKHNIIGCILQLRGHQYEYNATEMAKLQTTEDTIYEEFYIESTQPTGTHDREK